MTMPLSRRGGEEYRSSSRRSPDVQFRSEEFRAELGAPEVLFADRGPEYREEGERKAHVRERLGEKVPGAGPFEDNRPPAIERLGDKRPGQEAVNIDIEYKNHWSLKSAV